MQDLTVTLIQPDPVWEDVGANLDGYNKVVASLSDKTDLFIFPEMFTTGFSMQPSPIAEEMTETAVLWMKRTSADTGSDVVGSLIIKENGRYYNRLVWVKPDATLFTYDKRHLFRMTAEEKVYTAGEKLITVELNGWRIRPFICYDLRFPAWTRNIDNQYDVAIFVANWPSPRANAWRALLTARAIENLSYVIGVNRIGVDGNGLPFSGDSMVITPKGEPLARMRETTGTRSVRLSHDALVSFRREFPAWMDADRDMIQFPIL